MKSVLERLKEKYDFNQIIKNRYGERFLDYYLKSQKEILALEKLGYHIWDLFGLLWLGEKQDLILKILDGLNMIDRISLNFKKNLFQLAQEENKVELYEKDKLFWETVFSDFKWKDEWLDLDLNWDQLVEKKEKEMEESYLIAVRKLDQLIKN